jgi:hypothetical protein
MEELLGLAELARLFEMSKRATIDRTNEPGFPEPVRLACGPIWRKEQIEEYARQRSRRYHERPAIERLAAPAPPLPPDVLSVEEAAATLGTTPGRLRVLAGEWVGMPASWSMSGELKGIPKEGLGVYARALASELVETADLVA